MNFESIHNYYEALVTDHIMNSLAREGQYSDDALADIACLALNRLPARYVRHDEEMALFLTTRERERMQRRIEEAVRDGVAQIEGHSRRAGEL